VNEILIIAVLWWIIKKSKNWSTVESGVSYGSALRLYHSTNQVEVVSVLKTVRWSDVSGWWVTYQVRQSPACKDVSKKEEDIVGNCHQTKTGEDTADWEDLACAVVNCKVCELVTALQSLVLISCVHKCWINPITNPNPVYSHSITS
jgi:hypothetical protein